MTELPQEASPSFAAASALAEPSLIELPASETASIAVTSAGATTSIADESLIDCASNEESPRPIGVGPSLHATEKSAAQISKNNE